MKHFVSENPVGVILVLLAIAAALAAMGTQGCDLSQVIKVSVPQGIQGALNVPAKVTLNDAQDIYENFGAWSARQSRSFGENIETGWRWFGFFQGAMRIGLAEAGAAGIGALPFGGLALGLLTYVGGLYTRKPGTDRMVAKEKMESHNKGLEEGRKPGGPANPTA